MKTIQVICAIIHKEGKILVAQRSKLMSLPLKWEFPGGKMLSNETEEQCLHRELKEELNIEIKVEQKMKANMHDYGTFIINLIPYLASHIKGDIKLAEHANVKWFSKSELLSLDLAPADINVLSQILELDIAV